MDQIKRFNIRSIITSIVLILLGIAIIVNPNAILSIIVKILGVGIILDGVWHIFQFTNETWEEKAISIKLVQGLGEIFLGIMAIIHSTWVISVLYIIIGLWISMESILKLQMCILLKNEIINKKIPLIISILGIIIGIFIIANPLIASKYINIMMGVTIIVAELPNLIESIYLAIKLK